MTTTPVLSAGFAVPSALGLPVAFNDLNPVDALPNITGLIGAYCFGGSSLIGALRNFANPDLPLLAVGSPTINAVGATLNGVNGFNTQIVEPAAFTALGIVKNGGATFSFMRTAWGANDGGGALSPQGMRLTMGYSAGHSDPQIDVSSSATTIGNKASSGVGNLNPTGDWVQIIGRADATDCQVSDQHNNTRFDATATTTGAKFSSKRTIRLGVNDILETTAGTSFDILAAFIWNVRLSDSDRNATLSALRTWFNTTSGIGITTL